MQGNNYIRLIQQPGSAPAGLPGSLAQPGKPVQEQPAGVARFSQFALSLAEFSGNSREQLQAAAENIAQNGGFLVVPTVVGRG